MKKEAVLSIFCALVFLLQGCGYTTKTHLPENIKSVHVEKVTNSINITGEVTNRDSFKVYRPGLEVELRNALIEEFIFDGHLKIAEKDNADSVLQVNLLEYRRDPLRYKEISEIQEFRVNVIAAVEFIDLHTQEVLWKARGIAGNDTYFLSGKDARSEDQAVAGALKDISRHVVENVLEVW